MGSFTTAGDIQQSTNRLVLRNTLLLVGAKILSTPLSVLTNALVARYLGPEQFSHIYVATNFVSFGMLFVVFGQFGVLPAKVAVNRERSGVLLGSALLWNLLSGILVYGMLVVGCALLGYELEFQYALALVFLYSLVASALGAMLETIRGFERTDVDAVVNVAAPLLTAVITIPVLMLGGRLVAALAVNVVVQLVSSLFVLRVLKPVGVTKLSADRATVKSLLHQGSPFLFFGIAMAVQPVVDAGFLSKLAPAEVVGWHAAAQKLVGLLIFPASALVTALYPILCRLYEEDKASYGTTTAAALHVSMLAMVPIAMGCGLFPELPILVFDRAQFGSAEANLRVLAVFIFLVYFSMPLGSAVLAAGKARIWSIVQAACVVIAAVLDPILVPWFQENHENGGLGICYSNVAAEVFMVASGLWLLPRGALSRSLLRAFGVSLLGAGAMAGTAWALSSLNAFVACAGTLVAYVAVLWTTGSLSRQQLETVRSLFARKGV